MSITFTSTQPGSNADYMKYVALELQTLQKTDRYKDAAFLDFALVPADAQFVKLNRGAYITIDSTKYPKWFTGYITNDPDISYLGKRNGQAVYGYKYRAVSDDYILSLKPIGVIPPYTNMTMGAILKDLITQLVPNTFDVTNINDGLFVAQYVVDPTKKFLDIVHDFCDAANFIFYGNNKKLYFVQQDVAANGVTLDGNDKNYTPARLNIKPSASSPIINDATVLGLLEPQTYVNEYFVGTGLEGSFPLVSSVFGLDSYVLIDETFGSGISNQWVVYDTSANFLQVANGYLNCLGGSANLTFDVSLQSKAPIPLEGRLRFTHGEWDFVGTGGNQDGIIGGLWTGQPNSGWSGLIYGILFSSGKLQPIVGAVLDNTQSITVDSTKRYVMRTIAEFAKVARASQQYAYLDSTGHVQIINNSGQSDTVTWSTIITEIDPINGKITNQWTWHNAAGLSGVGDTFAIYAPLASNNLHATVTGITVSIPLNATLETSNLVAILNPGFESWDDPNTATNWGSVGVSQETTNVNSGGSALKLTVTTGVTIPYVYQSAASLIQPNTKYTVRFVAASSAALLAGQLKVVLQGTGITETGLTINIGGAGTPYEVYSGVLTTGLTSIPADLVLKIYLTGGTVNGYAFVDDLSIMTDWHAQLVGPNEIDAVDGLAPIATIVAGNSSAPIRNSFTGAQQYDQGQAQLVFFKDSVTRTSNTPPSNQLIRLAYRSAGPSAGRAVDLDSMQSEAVNWGDNGVRSIIRSDLVPVPRNDAECELAAAAVVAENSYQHYEGDYTQFSDYFTSEPKGGALFSFANLTGLAADLHAEEINEVVTTIEANLPVERFSHKITFGKPDLVRRMLRNFYQPKGQYVPNNANFSANIVPVTVQAVGKTYAPDIVKPTLVGWDDNSLYIDSNDTAITGLGFWGPYVEVRYTDEGWGPEPGKNLVIRSGLRTFTVPRTNRGRMLFMRRIDAGNYITYSEDLAQSIYTGGIVSKIRATDPDGNTSTICQMTLGSLSVSPTIPGGSNLCWTISIKGAAGKNFTMSGGGASKSFKTTGYWQRVSLPMTGSFANGPIALSLTSPDSVLVQLTRFSLEAGTLSETTYSRTVGGIYGPSSRYSTALHVSFPAPDVAVTSPSGSSSLLIRPTY